MRRSLALFLLAVVLGTAELSFGAERFADVAALLQIGVGARPLGMGGAFVGLADDENAAFYNPAALAFLERAGFTSLYSRQFQVLDYGAIGLAGRFIGINLLQLHSGGIEGANEFGNPDGTYFSYTSRAGIVSLGLGMGKVALGLRLKFYQELSDGVSGLGWALDPAVMIIRDRLRLGMLLENWFGGGIKFDNGHIEGWNLSLRIGGSLSLDLAAGARANLLLDLSSILDHGPHGHLGIELWVQELGIRVGLDRGSITLGSSVWLEGLRVDWAYASHPRLPDTNRLSLTVRF